jgi:hypothetical protein
MACILRLSTGGNCAKHDVGLPFWALSRFEVRPGARASHPPVICHSTAEGNRAQSGLDLGHCQAADQEAHERYDIQPAHSR